VAVCISIVGSKVCFFDWRGLLLQIVLADQPVLVEIRT